MSVIVATAYMDEARRFDWLIALDDGRVLAQDTRRAAGARPRRPLEEAFIALLPEEKRRGHEPVRIVPLALDDQAEIAIEARDLTMRATSWPWTTSTSASARARSSASWARTAAASPPP